MKNLRNEQPHLWQRVLALSVAFILLGLPLLFAPPGESDTQVLAQLIPLNFHGGIFLALGLGLVAGSFSTTKNYKLARVVLSISLGYMIAWLLSLLYGAFLSSISSFAIVSLWGYVTYTIHNTLRDPGFEISELIREVRNQKHD